MKYFLMTFLLAMNLANPIIVHANSRSNPAVIGDTVVTQVGHKTLEIELIEAKWIGSNPEGLHRFSSIPEGHEIWLGYYRMKVTQGIDEYFSVAPAHFQAVSGRGTVIPHVVILMDIEDSLYRDLGNIEFYGTNEISGWTWVIVEQNDQPLIVYRRGLQGQTWFNPNTRKMVDLRGLTFREARILLTQANLTLGKTIELIDSTMPENTVVSHTPSSGDLVYPGERVDFLISRHDNLEQVILPDIRGVDINEANVILTDAGLILGHAWPEFNTLIKDGQIIEQNPVPGRKVNVGTSVDVVYSTKEKIEEEISVRTGQWYSAVFAINVPLGSKQEVVILVIDDFGTREVYRQWIDGGKQINHTVEGRGIEAKAQVFIGGRLFGEFQFVDL